MPKNKSKQQVKVVVQKNKPKKQNKKQNNGKASVVGQALRAGGANIAKLLGLPATLGRSAGAGISRIFGQGDYMTNAPSQNSLMGGPPAFSPLTGGVRVRHREYIQDITGSTGFAYQTFQINPGLNATFPWLSQVAQNFEEYKIHGMIVYLNSTSASSIGSTNTALGLWGVVTQYDPAEPDFTNKQQCENYVGCQSAVPANSLLHGVECKPRSNVLDKMYVRTGATQDVEDLKFYDWGKVQLFTQGMQAASNLGEMWISYDIEFFKPRLPTGGYIAYNDRYAIIDSSNSLPYGSSWLPKQGNINTRVNALGQLEFPANAPLGYYLLCTTWGSQNNLTNVTFPTYTMSGSMTYGPSIFNNASGAMTNYQNAPVALSGATATTARVSTLFIVQKTALSSGTISFGAMTGLTGILATNLLVLRVDSSIIPVSSPQTVKMTNEQQEKLEKIMALLDGIDPEDIKALLHKEPEADAPSLIQEISYEKV